MSAAEPTLIHTLEALGDHRDGGFTFLSDDLEPRASLSYAQVVQRAEQEARRLRAAGIEPRDRVVLVLPEPEAFVHAFLGAILYGAIPVPVAPPMPFEHPRAYAARLGAILRVTDPALLIATPPLLAGMGRFPEWLGDVPSRAYDSLTDDGAPLAWFRPEATDVAFLQFTSGSTAAPKGVRVTHGSLGVNADAIVNRCLGAGPHDVAVNWLPLFHDMGLIGAVVSPLVCRMPVVHMTTSSFAQDPGRWMEAMDRFEGTYCFAPNFAYALAVRRTPRPERLRLSQVRMLGCAAEPISVDTVRAFEDYFAPAGLRPGAIVPCYGMAEATVAISFCTPGDPVEVDVIDAEAYRVDRVARSAAAGSASASASMGDEGSTTTFVSCGRVLPEHRVRVVDEDRRPVPERVVGEIVFEGASVADGYWNDPSSSAEVFVPPDGLRTGDLGYLAEGRIFVTGRRKDLIIVNGRNIDPQDIEWIAHGVPGVRAGNVAAFSIPGRDTEQAVVVAETKQAEHEALKAEIRARVRRDLALRLHDVVMVPPGGVSKTSSGKVQRHKVRAQYLDGKGDGT